MIKDTLVQDLKFVQEFFNRSTDCLTEEDSGFKPKDDLYTVAQIVGHVGLSIDWFVDGAFNPDGFDMEFAKHDEDARAVTSLAKGREIFAASIDNAIEVFGSKSDEELTSPLPEGIVMGGEQRRAVVGGISEHTAHHRGALAVYSRLMGKTPKMPYMDM